MKCDIVGPNVCMHTVRSHFARDIEERQATMGQAHGYERPEYFQHRPNRTDRTTGNNASRSTCISLRGGSPIVPLDIKQNERNER